MSTCSTTVLITSRGKKWGAHLTSRRTREKMKKKNVSWHVSDDEIDLRVARAVESRMEHVSRAVERQMEEKNMKIIALQKRLEQAEENRIRLEQAEENRIRMEERLEQAEENLANVLSHKSNILSVSEVSDDDESVSEVSDDDEPQLVWWCGTCEEKLKKKDDEIMDLKERLKYVEERLERAEKSRDNALELVEGPVIHSLKVILENTQEHLTSQRLSDDRRWGEYILCSARGGK